MMDDATVKAAVIAALDALNDETDNADLSYVDQLRRLSANVTAALADGGTPPTDEQHQAVLTALGVLDPHADDMDQDAGMLYRRLQVAVDRELSRWTSGYVQPPGPSGETAVAEPQKAD